MTDEGEFSARSQLKWAREGDAWILLYGRLTEREVGQLIDAMKGSRLLMDCHVLRESYSTVSFLLSKISSILSCVFAAERNFYKGTADGHLRVRSRALVHGRLHCSS